MAYIVTVDTRIPRINIERILPWWTTTQRRSLQLNERLLTAQETEIEARRRFGSTIPIIEIALSIDLNEEEMVRHITEISEDDALPRRRDRSLERGDVTRVGRPSDFKCVICLGTKGRVVRTACNHYFHRACIESAYKYSETCPVCRAAIKPSGNGSGAKK